jgi:hypothetical protein
MAKPAIAGKVWFSPCDVPPRPVACAPAQIVHRLLRDWEGVPLSVRACAHEVFHLMRVIVRLSGPVAPSQAMADYFRSFFVEGSICEG